MLGRGREGGRECFRVNIDKWVCGVSQGSREHGQLGQHTPRGTGKWGFYLLKTPERGGGRGEGVQQRQGWR